MFTSNPFAELTVFLPPRAMQVYIVLMVLAVIVGTIADMIHKSSAKYFALRQEKLKAAATRQLSRADKASLALKTLVVEVASAGEFCNPQRRISHSLVFYGFLLYQGITVLMIFGYQTHATPTPTIIPLLWNMDVIKFPIGADVFFFFIRLNLANESAEK